MPATIECCDWDTDTQKLDRPKMVAIANILSWEPAPWTGQEGIVQVWCYPQMCYFWKGSVGDFTRKVEEFYARR